jgi:hypothetical protein
MLCCAHVVLSIPHMRKKLSKLKSWPKSWKLDVALWWCRAIRPQVKKTFQSLNYRLISHRVLIIASCWCSVAWPSKIFEVKIITKKVANWTSRCVDLVLPNLAEKVFKVDIIAWKVTKFLVSHRVDVVSIGLRAWKKFST